MLFRSVAVSGSPVCQVSPFVKVQSFSSAPLHPFKSVPPAFPCPELYCQFPLNCAFGTNGEVAETSSANLFWIYRDTVYTTPTGRGALPGITRAVVLELCQALNLPTNKRVIKPESLRKSEGIFLSLSSLGIVPVSAIDGDPVPTSPIAEKILSAYYAVVQRETGS